MENLCIVYPNKFTYSETFIANQIKELKPGLTLSEGWYPSILASGKSFLYFPLNFIFFRGFFRNFFPKWYHKLYTDALAVFLLKRNIKVVLANYGPMGVAISTACQKARIDFVIHFHGFDISDSDTLNTYCDLYQSVFNNCKAIIAVSNDMKDRIISLGANPKNIYLNPYGIEVKKFEGANPENKEPIFIAVGRFTAKKAPHLTVKAFAKVLTQFPNAKLNMIGDGELLVFCKQLAIDLNITESINFLGIQSPDAVCNELKAAKIFVQHSITAPNGDSEGTPNTILEASAIGLPIVSTFHAGIKEAVINEKTGYLVQEQDWSTMADYMISLAADSFLCGEMGREGRKHIVRNYNLVDRIKSLKTILEA